MLSRLKRTPFATLASCLLATSAFAGYTPTTNFVDPDGWVVGSADSTYQEWDDLPNSTPDIGYSANPAISTQPTVSPTGSGFGTSSGNFYSFSSDYGFSSTIYNHGGSAGTGSYGAGSGTHVIIQTGSTTGIDISSIELYSPSNLGTPLTGGDNASALQHVSLFNGIVNSSFGDTDYQEDLLEFFIPDYVGDIVITGNLAVHSSFDRLRVDSMIASSAFATTVVPESSTYAMLFGVLTLGFVLHRRSRH